MRVVFGMNGHTFRSIIFYLIFVSTVMYFCSTVVSLRPRRISLIEIKPNVTGVPEEIKVDLHRSTQVNIPVVYTFFVENRNIHQANSELIPAYAWRTMTVTASFGNEVVLITSPNISLPNEAKGQGIGLYDIDSLETEDLRRFRQSYRPWGIKEPWERRNTERYFIISQYMKKEQLDLIFFADSDVVVLTKVSVDLLNKDRVCEGMLILQHNAPNMKWKTGDWVAWAGTSILTQPILDDFTHFANKMYHEDFIHWLELKRDNWPFVTDMSLWYLFVGASDKLWAVDWEWPNPYLPSTNKHVFCDIMDLGFSHLGGYEKKEGYNKITPTHKSIHFQGDRKSDALLLSTNDLAI